MIVPAIFVAMFMGCSENKTRKGDEPMIQQLLLATECLEKTDYSKSKSISMNILSSDPNNPLAIEIAAISMRMLGEQPESSKMRERQAALPPSELSEREKEIKSRLAKQSVRFINYIANSCEPEALHYADLGGMCAMRGDFLQAEEYFKKAIHISPDCEPVYFNQAVMAFNRKDFKSAEQSAKAVLRINPSNKDAQKMLELLNVATK